MAILLDPGHGGRDPGAVVPGIPTEAHLNLALCHRVEALLKYYKEVRLTRTYGMPEHEIPTLQGRIDKIKKVGASLLVSIHHNAVFNTVANGLEVFYKQGCIDSQKLAEKLQYGIRWSVYRETGYNFTDRGIKTKPFFILRNSPVPAILIEAGFLTNKEDRTIVANQLGQMVLGFAIAKTLL